MLMNLRLAGALSAAVAALALAGAASATTEPEMTTNVRVTLTNGAVSFTPKLHPNTNTTLIVQVVNRGTRKRWFRLAGRKTRLLAKGEKELFYYSFHLAGPVAWRSGGAGVKLLRGKVVVSVAPMVNYG